MTQLAAEPDHAAVVAAAARLAGRVHRTPVLRSRQLDQRSRAQVVLKCEHLQKVGAFKARGATNAVLRLDAERAARGVAAHSSGNHAQALAWAAASVGVPAWVVMPRSASRVKVEAVRGYGATVVTSEDSQASREATLAEVVAATGAEEIHPYDHPDVIAGAGTAALELLEDEPDLDTLLVPVGGGGLLSGTVLAADGRVAVWAAEPAAADNAARSVTAGRRLGQEPPVTVADGLTTTLSERTFRIGALGATQIVTVEEDEIVAAMRCCWERLKQVVEPSAAVPVAALLRGDLAGRRVGVVLSGGNVDLDALPW